MKFSKANPWPGFSQDLSQSLIIITEVFCFLFVRYRSYRLWEEWEVFNDNLSVCNVCKYFALRDQGKKVWFFCLSSKIDFNEKHPKKSKQEAILEDYRRGMDPVDFVWSNVVWCRNVTDCTSLSNINKVFKLTICSKDK